MLQNEMVDAMRKDRSLGCADLSRFVLHLCIYYIINISLNYPLFHKSFLCGCFRWLTMAQLMAASFGEKILSVEHWQMVKEIERLRKERS